jgi:hypothetical protein
MIPAFAGPNEDARLYFDAVAETDSIEAEGACPPESTITFTVRITDASNLFSYSFYIGFDTASLAFVSGKRGNDQNMNFLEKNDGSGSFTSRISIHDSTRILVGCYLSGSDESQCVTGSGTLGLFTFRHKKKDTTTVSIDSSTLIDCDLVEDRAESCSPGTIIPSSGIRVIYSRAAKRSVPRVKIRKGMLAVDFTGKTFYSLTAVNTLGKKIYSTEGCSEQCTFDMRELSAVKGNPRLTIVRISFAGKNLVVPLLQ